MASEHKAFAPKVPLSGRTQIHKLDAGLTSVRGAQDIITMISERRTVTKLVLGHNDLGNEGTIVLFRFLESALGRNYPISEISLNSNGIKDEGLVAISRYLKENRELKELFLQGNAFTGNPAVTRAFVEALNSSRLEIISLTTNHGLGDAFIESFMPHLNAPCLRELHISSIGLTPRSVPHIVSYIRSPERCRLHTLRCNGNSLGLRGVKSIIRAIQQKNYSLISMECWANQLSGDNSNLPQHMSDGEEDEDEEVDETSVEVWKVCLAQLGGLRMRNEHLKKETQGQALDLLRYSRVLILRSSLRPEALASPLEALHLRTQAQGSEEDTRRDVFPFTHLPTELQLSILSLLAPSLSSAQRSQIFSYAADPSTLPPLLPALRRNVASCLPDPFANPALSAGGSGSLWPVNGTNRDGHCSGGQCMGAMNAVSCNKDKERIRWLDAVGCSIYDPE
ncbi:hypothetical protein D9611_010457 [Ephemerocybe angulata]|uniref:RNI-like protein n=1 Tax=Ephemerocybe angulata TaxID=980116 RepID=A0A8H5FB83_9AGAR|nr:hypothetical protein D9611_010457 [Tulosesus angulatus]